MSLVFDPSDPDLKAKVLQLQPTAGYCIFADIVGSTQLKDDTLPQWASRIYNTFTLIRSFLPFQFPPLKSMGDALMFYVTEAALSQAGESALQLFGGLCSVVQESEGIFAAGKISVAYCRDAYELTFLHGTRDIYGKDIDLSARLLSVASEREIIMNEAFVEQVRRDYQRAGNKNQFTDVPKITGPWPQLFKGFSGYVPIYKLPREVT